MRLASAFSGAPPWPVMPMEVAPCWLAYSIARRTLGERPLVLMPMTTSPGGHEGAQLVGKDLGEVEVVGGGGDGRG